MTGVLGSVRTKLAAHRPRRVVDCEAAPAAVAVLVTTGTDGRSELFFIRRAARDGDPWSGQIGLPGGRRASGDFDLYETVVRETFEETNISLSKGLLLGELDDLYPNTKSLPPVVVRPYVFGLPQRPAVVQNEEVTSHFWVDTVHLSASEQQTAVAVRGAHLKVDAYVVGDNVIWGITYRIIKGFLNLVNS